MVTDPSGRRHTPDPPRLDLDDCRRLVVAVAHPDDESLGTGGLIATAGKLGILVDIVIATSGENSHPHSRTVTPALLRRTREGEVQRAVALLHPDARVHLLRLPDSGLSAEESTLVDGIGDVLGDATDGTWIVANWRHDSHPDHEVVGRAAAHIAEIRGIPLLEFPLWGWWWPDHPEGLAPEVVRRLVRPAGGALTVLPLTTEAAQAKRAAIDAYRSQLDPLSTETGDEAVLPPELITTLTGDTEWYFNRQPAPAARHYFDALYTATDDPWDLEDRWYERRKRALVTAVLPRERFRRAFEPGCSTGILTQFLAGRCDELLAADLAAQPLATARRRVPDPHVEFRQLAVPAQWPDGWFDLVVVSEIGYYLKSSELDVLIARIRTSLEPGGAVVACHWRHPIDTWPLTGDDVHQRLRATDSLALFSEYSEADFLLDVFLKRDRAG